MEILALLKSFECIVIVYLLCFVATVWATFIAVRSATVDADRRHQIVLFICAAFFWIIYTVFGWNIVTKLSAVPTIAVTSPHIHEVLDAKLPTITVTFATPVHFKTLGIHVYPESDITIQTKGYGANRMSIGRTLSISFNTTLPPNEHILVYVSNIKGPLTYDYGGEHMLEFVSPELPTVTRVEPADTEKGIDPSSSFTVSLSHPATLASLWEARITPSHPISVEKRGDATLVIAPDEPFQQGTSYTLSIIQTPVVALYTDATVIRRGNPRVEKTLTFTTIKPPLVKAFEPQGSSVNPASDIRIVFDEPMDKSSVAQRLTISPDSAKTLVWESEGQVLRIRHADLTKDTTYTVTLASGVKTARGGSSQSDGVFQFHTAGALAVVDTLPHNGKTDVSVTEPIRITFNHDIDEGHAPRYISISPAATGKVTTSGATLEFMPDKPLAHDTTYTFRLISGMPSVYGLPLHDAHSFSFTTAPYEITLDVPFYKQQEQFTCNIAALRMLLAFRGHAVDEATLKTLAGNGGKRGTGNPHKGYIDDYGTYWEPIEKAASHYRPHRMITSGNVLDIVKEIRNGNPVMIWGQNGWSDPHDISWTSSDGVFIKAVNGMHSSVVRGVRGPLNTPTHVLINDPWRGQYAIDVKEFLRRWSFFNVAMVIE